VVTYLLIPGAGGSAWYWHLTEAELRRRGQDVVAVDLPAADDKAGWSEYAAVVVDAVGDRTDLVVVGQSMGGFTASLVCSQLPAQLLVLLNPMIPAPGETGGDWWSNTGQPQARRANDISAGRDPDAPFDLRTMFFHDVPEDVTAQALAVEQPQSDTPFGQAWPLAAWPDVPTRVLSGRDDRFFPVDFQRRVASERLGSAIRDEMPGGHLVALAYPVELAERLEAYRRELLEP
jgi:pimeloyl-ACP methyl ester carboxylesterase